MGRPLQTQSVPSRQVDAQFATSVSALQNSSHNLSTDLISGNDNEDNHTQSGGPEARGSSNSSHQLSDLSTVDQELPTHGSSHSRRSLPISTLVGRHTLQRKRGVALRLLAAFLGVSLGVYLAKYLSRCVLPLRRAGQSSDATPPGLQHEDTRFRVSGPLSSVTGNGRRLAAAEWGGGSGKPPETTGSQGESKDPICENRDVNDVEDVPPEKIVPPVSVSEEALLLREIAKQVMSAAGTTSSALSKCHHSGDELRGVLQSLTDLYGKILDQAEKVEKYDGNEETSMTAERSSESGRVATTAARTTADHIRHTQTEERGGEPTSSALSKDRQFPHPPRPISAGMHIWSGSQISLETIFETEETQLRGATLFHLPWLQSVPSTKTMDTYSIKDTGEDVNSLAEALQVVQTADATRSSWDPFSSTTSTSDAWEKFLTQQNDAKEHPGDDGSGPEGGDQSQCQKTGSDKKGSKQQQSSSEKRKKRGASGHESRQTKTGAAQQSGGFSDTTVASGTEAMAPERGAEDDSNADDDGQDALQGRLPGAQKDSGQDTESEEVGGKKDGAGADEAGDEAAAKEALRTGARPKTSSTASKRKQKTRQTKTELPVPSGPPSTGTEEEVITQTRGRARQRAYLGARRGGAESGHDTSKGTERYPGGRRRAEGQSSDRVSGKGSKAAERKLPTSPSLDFGGLAANVKRKLSTILEKYGERQKQLHDIPGAKAFLDVALRGELTKTDMYPGNYHGLSKAVLLEAEHAYTLKALLEVADGLRRREEKLKEEKAHGLHASSGATAEEDAAGAAGSEDSPLKAVIEDIVAAAASCNERRMSLLAAEKWVRSFHIVSSLLPELPEIVLPLLPGEEGYEYDTDEGEETSEGLPDTRDDPLEAVLTIKQTIEQWESKIAPLITSVEARWWRPPADPDEAIRQRQRTAAMFKVAAAAITRRFLKLALQDWNVEEGIRHSRDPATKQKLLQARQLLAVYIAEKEAVEWENSAAFVASISATATANVRNPQKRWDPVPSNDHAPDIRAAIDNYRQMSS
ncbi:UNVERIFIED_CONTAM: Toxoplasma gondii family E protein [Hammondia hammondi]|eukprot:XP_008887794.1 Toxoplasma gondii family E protein [Hammondia hammondi]